MITKVPTFEMMSQFERFGKYILLEKLAAGGMAEIYLAKSLGASGVNKFLAVKRILPQFSENTEFKDMFREEAKVSVNLRHSNVVPIFDFGEEKGHFYIVMDYVEGRNLRQILNELKKLQIQFAIEQICYVVREAAGGLDHAHRCIDGSTGRPLNIIHRDISPQNIMISFEGEVKIIDFGIAKAETQAEATKAGTLKGKYGYMSPEQADGQNIDVRTDIFSLGIVLWELLANDRLFTASSEAAILRKIRECQIPSIRKINPNVPPELEKIVNKVLAKDPNLRYQTAAALHKDLNRFLNTQFPDFNAQDFAVFIKNAFAQTYQETKRKLVDYAKSEAGDVRPPTPQVTGPANEATVIDKSVPPLEEDSPFKGATNTKLNLSDLKKADDDRSINLKTGVLLAQAQAQAAQTAGRTATGMPRSQTGIIRPPPAGPSFVDTAIDWGVRLGAFAIFAAGGWWAWQNGLIESMISKPANPPAAHQPSEQTEDQASTQSFQVMIHSEPVGARIYLDGVDTRTFTPRSMVLPANKSVHITLKKEDYYHSEIDFTPLRDAQSAHLTLQPLGRAAYINIAQVFGGGSDPIIEINGRRVGDKMPIRMYPIPAGVEVQIRARNAFTGTMTETSVLLEPDSKRDLELIIGAPPR